MQSKFSREDVSGTDHLMSKLKQLIPKNSKNSYYDDSKADGKSTVQKIQSVKKPCIYCEMAGFENRFHPENLCRTKKKTV